MIIKRTYFKQPGAEHLIIRPDGGISCETHGELSRSFHEAPVLLIWDKTLKEEIEQIICPECLSDLFEIKEATSDEDPYNWRETSSRMV